ncbi:MAG: hypothetical protein JXR31_15695, partial [Prolixibacteraceae bacterium]|nr:hypothetical protein [Prolixibacteraceae bacterium]
MKRLLLFLIIPVITGSLSGQDIEKQPVSQKPVLYEKLYLHTDRDLYSTGDTIWFKSYLVSGMTNKLIEGYKNIYVQLVESGGKVVANRLLLSVNGESKGDIAIPDSINDGQYTLRVFTKYLKNFGEESLFHKRIWISTPKSSLNLEFTQEENTDPIDVMFFPEGGNLVLNAVNYVAFKAVDSSGKGIGVKGQIMDGDGNIINSFESGFMGMGKFVLMPSEGKTYYAKVEGYPRFLYRFENILENGVSIHYSDEGADVLVSVIRNIKKQGAQKFYLAGSHKGVVLFQKEIELNDINYTEVIGKNRFPLGISKISLLDTDFHIIAERLVFISDGDFNNVDIEIDKEEFRTREKVNININPRFEESDTIKGNFSVSVVNDNYMGSNGNTLSLQSYLLIDSDLKGAIESPARYFSNDEGMAAEKKLDLLMMVQGWRSYYWDEIIKKASEDLDGWDDAGLTISGHVSRLLRDKPVVGGEVVIGPFS